MTRKKIQKNRQNTQTNRAREKKLLNVQTCEQCLSCLPIPSVVKDQFDDKTVLLSSMSSTLFLPIISFFFLFIFSYEEIEQQSIEKEEKNQLALHFCTKIVTEIFLFSPRLQSRRNDNSSVFLFLTMARTIE